MAGSGAGESMAGTTSGSSNAGVIRLLTFLMFMMFAMTTDSVGVIIPQIIKDYHLGLTAAGSFHYATMAAIALSGLLLGFLADRIGRKRTIILGLVIFSLDACLFAVGGAFGYFVVLLMISGTAIGVFKTGALALIGDISRSTTEHTSTMNTVEGFFGVGAIIGPLIVTALLAQGMAWKWLYVIAGGVCVLLILTALSVKYPNPKHASAQPVDLRGTLAMMKNGYAVAFGMAALLYVAVECAIYVWMPTLLQNYQGGAVLIAGYALPIFFVLRAGGRFLGAWMLHHFRWSAVLAFCGLAIMLCFLGSLVGGTAAAVYLLPLSGLFMSVVYPTINSKGISCFAKAQHGTVAGVILFFTAVGAVLGPLAMGAVSDHWGGARYGFMLASTLAVLLFALTCFNWLASPVAARLQLLEQSEY